MGGIFLIIQVSGVGEKSGPNAKWNVQLTSTNRESLYPNKYSTTSNRFLALPFVVVAVYYLAKRGHLARELTAPKAA